MPRSAWATGLSVCLLATLGGCAENSMVMKGQLQRLQEQQVAQSRQLQDWQTRANEKDRDNQELHTLLAQVRQEAKDHEDRFNAVREQLRGVTDQLADARAAKTGVDDRVKAMEASMRRQGGVSISPNNSLLQTLPAIDLPPGCVRQDGDVIRVTLPGSQMFEPATARLRLGADKLIVAAANEIYQLYPDQLLGVEGHTDSDPPASQYWRDNHQLSAARAMAVYDVLVTRTRFQPGQVFISAHGANHPLSSNGTPQGKETNRRVEMVIYPERLSDKRGS